MIEKLYLCAQSRVLQLENPHNLCNTSHVISFSVIETIAMLKSNHRNGSLEASHCFFRTLYCLQKNEGVS